MPSIKDEALNFESKKRKVVSDLPFFEISHAVMSEDKVDKSGKAYTEKYITLNSVEYRVPDSVLAQVKELLEDNKNLKKVKVKASGSGMSTKYQVFPVSD